MLRDWQRRLDDLKLETYPAEWVVDLMFLVFFVSQRGNYSDASHCACAEERPRGRTESVGWLSQRAHRALDEYGIYRSLTEHLAAEWVDGSVVNILVFGGWPFGVAFYATIVAAVDALAADDKAEQTSLDRQSTGIYRRLAARSNCRVLVVWQFARADGAPYSFCPGHGANGVLHLRLRMVGCRRDGRRALARDRRA